MSNSVMLTAGLLCGVFVFFVALPIALSNPYPTPNRRTWAVPQSPVAKSSASGFQLASAASVPVTIKPRAADLEPQEKLAPFKKVASLVIFRRDGTSSRTMVDAPPAPAAMPPVSGKAIPMDEIKAEPAVEEAKPNSAGKRGTVSLDDVDAYLWEVYQRTRVKKDRSGDFTWKDPAAAKKVGKTLQTYVIMGMDRDFREQLYHAGKAMDAAGIRWSILSAFRDDYRQRIASGLKARAGYSRHGGSRRTGGYGHGEAVDVTGADDNFGEVVKWIDKHGRKYGLHRPYRFDPPHVEPIRGDWRKVARNLRKQRTGVAVAEANEPDEEEAKPARKRVRSARSYRRSARTRRRR